MTPPTPPTPPVPAPPAPSPTPPAPGSVGPTPAEIRENERDRRSAWRVGVVTALAALLGAAVGGLFSYLATTNAATSQADQAREQQRRTEKVAAYTKLITDFTSPGNDLLGLYGINRADFVPPSPTVIKPALTTLFQTITSDGVAVSLVGPRSVSDSCNEAINDYVAEFELLLAWSEKLGSNAPEDQSAQAFKDFVEASSQSDTTANACLAAMQADLG